MSDLIERLIAFGEQQYAWTDGDNLCAEAVDEIRRLRRELETCEKKRIRAQQKADEAYRQGLREGMTRFAWWRDGVQYVGTCGTTLKEALEEIENETIN